MKLFKSKSFGFGIKSNDGVDKVYGDINELMDLVEQIEDMLEKESQKEMMTDNATVTVSEKGMKKIRKMCEL